jgi:hypothetical protein
MEKMLPWAIALAVSIGLWALIAWGIWSVWHALA